MRAKKQLAIGGGALLLCAAVAALLIWLRSGPPATEPPAEAPLVRTAPVEIRTGALQVTGTGTVRALAEVAVSPQVSGRVVAVNPSLVAGGRVADGAILFRIERADYLNRVEQARADVAQQQVGLLQADEEAELARREYRAFRERRAGLGDDGAVIVDGDDYAARILPPGTDTTSGDPAGVLADTAALPEEPGGLVFREPQRRAAQASLDRAEASLADAELALERTVVRAPFRAFVRSKDVAVGSYVTPGQIAARLVASDLLEVAVPLTRDQAALIPELWASPGPGDVPAEVYAEYGGFRYRWDAYLDRAEAVLDEDTRTIDVIVRVPRPVDGGSLELEPGGVDPGAGFRPRQAPPLLVGEFVRVEIRGARPERWVGVPSAAVRPDDEIYAVRDGRLLILPFEIYQRLDEVVYGRAPGLVEGDRVVVGTLDVATPGMEVRLADDAAAGGAAADTEGGSGSAGGG